MWEMPSSLGRTPLGVIAAQRARLAASCALTVSCGPRCGGQEDGWHDLEDAEKAFEQCDCEVLQDLEQIKERSLTSIGHSRS